MSDLIVSALVAVATTILTLVVKEYVDRRSHVSRLQVEFRHEHRRKIKECIACFKVRIVGACERLNYRCWNLVENSSAGWQFANGCYDRPRDHYYFASFVYRIAEVFAWLKVFEDQIVYLDTTVADSEDLEFVRYTKILPQLMTDARLFDPFSYDRNYATDHLFANHLQAAADSLVVDGRVLSYSEYLSHYDDIEESLRPLCHFLDGVNPETKKLAWERMRCLHAGLMAFLNRFGYDFNNTSDEKLSDLRTRAGDLMLGAQYLGLLNDFKFAWDSEAKRVTYRLMRTPNV